MGYGKSGMGGQHPIMKHMTKAGGGTGTSQSMSKNANIKYGGPVIDKESPMKNMYGDAPLEVGDEKKKKKVNTVADSAKNFKTSQYRKGVDRIKEGGDSRFRKISTRTGRDKVAGSGGNKLVRSKKGGSTTVVVEKSVNALTPKKIKKTKIGLSNL